MKPFRRRERASVGWWMEIRKLPVASWRAPSCDSASMEVQRAGTQRGPLLLQLLPLGSLNKYATVSSIGAA
jgi:hypothetical protein